MTATELCPDWARVNACCTRSRNKFLFASSVSGSWKASCRSCSSSALRSLISRKLSASPCTAGSSVRLLPTPSITQRRAPRSMRSSTGPTVPERAAATSARNILTFSPSSPTHRSGRLLPVISSGLSPKVRSQAGDTKRRTPSAATIIMTSEAFAISDAYRSSTMRAARRSRSNASPRKTTPCRTMNSSVSANTIMVITVVGPPMSPRAKYTSTRNAASIAA